LCSRLAAFVGSGRKNDGVPTDEAVAPGGGTDRRDADPRRPAACGDEAARRLELVLPAQARVASEAECGSGLREEEAFDARPAAVD
jgi:hypothetical protein